MQPAPAPAPSLPRSTGAVAPACGANASAASAMRTLCVLAAVLLSPRALGEPPLDAPDGSQWSFEHLVDEARALAERRYREPDAELPEALRELDYDGHRTIRYRDERALWAGRARYSAQFFHPGFLFDRPVTINVVEAGEARRVTFDGSLFEYGHLVSDLARALDGADIGFAGFRLLYPLNEPGKQDEVATFLGASYFRLLGPGHVYGMSARGLAIDTASPGGEEFPAFREFWLEEPDGDASELTFHALLDSPSATGAYRFDLVVGERTELTVEARLFARRDVEKVGIAPLTSMFMYTENMPRAMDDFRPRVHDSDGLLVEGASGEWIWRPLHNPNSLRVSALVDEDPRGFGLVQRERGFDRYLDLEARYERRPSLWVEPLGEWGAGHVELVEIPSDSETNDNVVAYWVPRERLRAGDERRYRYRLTTFDDRLERQHKARVVRTRIGWGAVPGEADPPSRRTRRFVIDYVGGALAELPADVLPEAKLSGARGDVEDLNLQPLPDGGGWRASFLLTPAGEGPEDLRLYLAHDGERLSETWTRVWYSDELPD